MRPSRRTRAQWHLMTAWLITWFLHDSVPGVQSPQSALLPHCGSGSTRKPLAVVQLPNESAAHFTFPCDGSGSGAPLQL